MMVGFLLRIQAKCGKYIYINLRIFLIGVAKHRMQHRTNNITVAADSILRQYYPYYVTHTTSPIFPDIAYYILCAELTRQGNMANIK
jgi:hypothetical protein